MQCICKCMALGLLLTAPALLAQTAADPTSTTDTAPAAAPRHSSHKAPTPVALPQMPSGPLSQVPMEQIPATPAKVTFQGGLLEISAQNSTLGEILRNVRKLTGATIDIPTGSNAANERVVTHLGPGAPRDVLAVLLNGSSFNYVMVGSSTDPTAVSSVLLSVKPSATGENKTAANVYQNSPQPMPPNPMFPRPFNQQFPQPGGAQPMAVQAQPSAGEAEDLKEDDQENADDTTADDQNQPAQPDAADTNANAQVQPAQPDPSQPNAGPRTPEQIMEMLRRQQQPGGVPVPPSQAPPQQQ